MNSLSPPILESYWVLPGRFLAGRYPGLPGAESGTRRRLAAFLDAGFDTFIDLTCAGERPAYLPLLQAEARARDRIVQHRRFSFPDFNIPTHASMVAALDAIDAALTGNRIVYLHCFGGIGRTGTTVGCWLIRQGLKPAAALFRLQELYQAAGQSLNSPRSPETVEQVNFILHWEEHGLA
jgi:hypothetical protein